MKKITFDKFYSQYGLKRNPIELSSPYENTMLDFGDNELDYIESQPLTRVWTLIEDENMFRITPGIHYNQVVGYFVSNRPWISEKQEYVLI